MDELDRTRIIIRLQSNLASEKGIGDPAAFLRELDGIRWRRLVERYGEIDVAPVFTAVPAEQLAELQRKAAGRDPSYRPEPLTAFLQLRPKPGADLDAIAKELRSWPDIRSVDVEIVGPDPFVNDADDPRAVDQDYLDAAPVGIDARYAWTLPGGDGAGQAVVDVERGWTFNHEDLVAHGVTLLHGAVLDSSRAHGTSVLGEICAVDNALGCVGIAPNLASVRTSSYSTSSIQNAIIAALASMSFGDVMLIEIQVVAFMSAGSPVYGPIEVIDASYEALRLATALGIVVVEAGGNGFNNGGTPAVDLDTYTNGAGHRILWRNSANPDFRDSGAIIVAAARSATPHTRLAYSTFGARIDCFAWGENIDTLSSNAAGATSLYTSFFGGTSGASPVVTGAALCVQGAYQAAYGFRLGPRQMRELISNPALNTAPAATETTAMGVMPDLGQLLGTQLGLVPDVYLRDFVGDSGEAHMGAISASPDVILRPTAVADPQAAFGAGSGTENDATLGFEAEAGQNNFVYVRALNQGGAAANNTTADVYWSPVATLVTPDLWTLVGSTTIPLIPIGEQLTCSSAITWPAAEIPGPGHYCFVGIIGTAGDPAPLPADFTDFDNFRLFIRNNNNVTWRNFNVVDNDPSPNADPQGFVALPFLVPGAPDRARAFALELGLRLAPGAEVLLEVPLRFLREMKADLAVYKVDERCGRAWAKVPAIGRVAFGPGLMQAKARHNLRLLVRLPKEARKATWRVIARQLYQGEEVGRVTWQLMPGVRDRRDKERNGRRHKTS